MTSHDDMPAPPASSGLAGIPWRLIGWTAAALLLLAPLAAMPFTDEVHWTGSDFALAAVLILSVGVPLELVARRSGDRTYRAATALALLTAFAIVWLSGAVGIIGAESDPLNLLYGGVLAVGLLGALVARLRARGMARALYATALAVAAVAVVALVAGRGASGREVAEILALNGMFAALFAASGWLFQRSAGGAPARGGV